MFVMQKGRGDFFQKMLLFHSTVMESRLTRKQKKEERRRFEVGEGRRRSLPCPTTTVVWRRGGKFSGLIQMQTPPFVPSGPLASFSRQLLTPRTPLPLGDRKRGVWGSNLSQGRLGRKGWVGRGLGGLPWIEEGSSRPAQQIERKSPPKDRVQQGMAVEKSPEVLAAVFGLLFSVADRCHGNGLR